MFKRELNAKLILSVIATGIMFFSGVVVETALNVTFPTLMEEFSIGTSTVQWMTTSYLLYKHIKKARYPKRYLAFNVNV